MGLWVSISSLNQLATFIANGTSDNNRKDGYGLGMGVGSASSTVSIRLGGGSGSSALGLDPFSSTDVNKWVHLVILRANGVYKFYWNGSVRTSGTINYTPATPTKFTIGSLGSQDYFKGSLDDIRIYNRVLTDSEILSLYNE